MTAVQQAQFEQEQHERDRNRIVLAAKLPASHVVLSQFNGDPRWAAAYQQVRNLLFEDGRVGATVAMIGPNGTGKTQIAVRVALDFAERLKNSKYVKADDLFDEIHDARNTNGAAVRTTIHKWSAPALLIIDEIDKRGESWFEDRTICRIVDDRYVACRHTLLMGNYSREGFEKTMDKSILSRIDERGAIIMCDWPSFRSKGGLAR